MKCVNTLFQQYCEKVIRKLKQDDIENFKKIDHDENRIKFLYDFTKDVPLKVENEFKNFEKAQQEKTFGNSYFAKKDYEKAIVLYNSAIIKCPQNTDEGRELLAILISNRSATFFEMKIYEKVLNDIEYLTFLDSYPKHLLHKVWLRKAKCFEFYEDHEHATEAYEKTLEYLKNSDLDSKTISTKINEVERQLEASKQNKTLTNKQLEIATFYRKEDFSSNIKYSAVHFDIMFDEDKIQGRFARAAEDISPGTILVQENAHTCVLSAANVLTNCQNCVLSINQPIACENCVNVVFCSLKCYKEAKESYHQVECSIQPSIFYSGASINCSLALRLITQKKFNFFLEKRETLEAYIKGFKLDEFKNKIYASNDYDTVFFLCRNEEMRKNEQMIHYTCMAIFLLRYLKTTIYFDSVGNGNILTENEAFIGGLILRHLQILQFNAHEISELRKPSQKGISGYLSEYIGAGLYPTLALFNHSCDPSIVRYNIGSKMIAHAIKPIKAGDIVYENYGPLYTIMEKDKRQDILKERYWFECLCKPCVELWPSLDEMNEEILRIPCKRPRCPKVFELKKDIDNPFLTCNFCNECTNIFPYLKGLMALETLMPEAENLYNCFHFEKATQKFLQALNIYYQHTVPPCTDLVKVQQRLRTCFIHQGNKAIDYEDFIKH